MGDLSKLELFTGEKVTAAHINQLSRSIAQRPGFRARGVLRRQRPWGVNESFHGTESANDAPFFQPTVAVQDDIAEVRWDGPAAPIAGFEPITPDNSLLSGARAEPGVPPGFQGGIFTEDPETGLRPALKVTKDDFDPATGECRIYFRVYTNKSFDPVVAVAMAFPGAPPALPYMAHTLALFLRLRDGAITYDESADRGLFCGQAMMAVQRRPDGRFDGLFYSTTSGTAVSALSLASAARVDGILGVV